jgi:prepilin-type N-terminal cleavage/methylation domain-containing protein
MQLLPSTSIRSVRRPPSGFSLVELMIVVSIIGVLIAISAPSYQRAMEQSRADTAAANLRAIWAAERLFWLEGHTFTDNLAGLQALGLLDPEIVLSANGYSYSVTSASATAFRAVAQRRPGTGWTGNFTIDETGQIGGDVQAAGQPIIVAGYQ